MRVLDLFSGIGGFALAGEREGFETVAFCEIEPFCQKVLRKHWTTQKIHSDIRELDARKYRGTIDVVSAGYPCQPFSGAGQRRGEKDDRSLWKEVLRIINESQPTWFIGENVAGHITLGLETVLSDLEAANYETRVFVIPACGVGANHRRDRCWILSHAKSVRSGRRGSKKHSSTKRKFQQSEPKRDEVWSEVEGCDLLSRWWDAEPRVDRVADGIPDRMDRLKSLGNSIVPQVAQQIFKAIKEAEHATK